MFDKLQEQLMKVNDGLVFEFSSLENGIREIVISGDGMIEMIPVVQSLVERAPELKGWKVIAFRPRIGAEFRIDYAGYLIDANSVTLEYEVTQDGAMLDLNLYVADYVDEMKAALYLLLDAIIGEYDVMTRLRYIEFGLPREGVNTPLSQLPEIIDRLLPPD